MNTYQFLNKAAELFEEADKYFEVSQDVHDHLIQTKAVEIKDSKFNEAINKVFTSCDNILDSLRGVIPKINRSKNEVSIAYRN